MDKYTDIRREGQFYDDVHFPRGFSKYGVFTIKEAEALHDYGKVMFKLANQQIDPLSRDEEHFISVCQLKAKPKTSLEKLWMKYQATISTRADCYTVHSTFNTSTKSNFASIPEGHAA